MKLYPAATGGAQARIGTRQPSSTADRPVRAYLPMNLDLAPVLPSDWADWADYGRFVVSGLYLRRHLEKQRADDAFRPTSSAVLKGVLPRRHYRDIMDALLGARVIEARLNADGRESYRAGHECKGFRLAAAYRDAEFRSVHLTHAELVRKMRARREREAAGPMHPVHAHLRAQLARLGVTADYPVVSLPLTCIDHQEFFFTPDPYGRVHTPLTNLDAALRPFIRADGRRLWQVDVTNSQPLLMALALAGRGLADGGFDGYRACLRENCRKTSPSNTQPPTTHPTYPYRDTFSGGGQTDAERFLGLCLDGGIYEHLMGLTGYDRATVKKRFFAVAYGRPWQAERTVMGRAFRAAFPGVWARVCALNARDHGTLARLMQTVESYVVVWRVCARIMREWPDAALFTLHDSLVADECHIETFTGVLMEEFRAVFGVEPKLTTKPF